jgi:hypothetical protein
VHEYTLPEINHDGGGEGKVTQTLGNGRAGRDDNWRRMENEGRREEKKRRTTPKKPETETIDI